MFRILSLPTIFECKSESSKVLCYTTEQLVGYRLEDSHAAFDCAVAVSPEDRASVKAQWRVTERLAELRAAVQPTNAGTDVEGDAAHTDLDEMD